MISFLCCLVSLISIDVNLSGIHTLEVENYNSEEVWGPLLEDYVTSNNNRELRVLKSITNSDVQTADTIQRKDSANNREQSKISSGNKIMNSGTDSYPNAVNNANNIKPVPQNQVSETDLYLLGAIEKLVHRVDFMEKRLRRLEQMLFYTMAGNRIDQERCNNNFTRISNGCYLFASPARGFDWKMANKYCHKFGTHLVEFETLEEYEDINSFLQNNPDLRGKDYWTGGLYPGLLWIWSNSGRPINTSRKHRRNNSTNSSTPIQLNILEIHKSNWSSTPLDRETRAVEDDYINSRIKMSGANIKGQGPCLRLEYEPEMRTHIYKGTDCSARYNYICEHVDSVSSNQIRRLGRNRNIISDEL